MVDGQRAFEGILRAGQSASWSGHNDVLLRVGNAASLDVVFNGTDLGPLGTPGEVLQRDFRK